MKPYVHHGRVFSISYNSIERQRPFKDLVYTDGSKKDFAIGAGIYYPYMNMKWGYGGYYPDKSSVRAELIAISIALKLFYFKDIVILTDSASSLDLIVSIFENKENFNLHSHGNVLVDIHDSMMRRHANSLSTRFFKVKAHSGEHGNTIADALARKARLEFEKKNIYL
jgi:ribonuclease HI